LSSCCPTIVSLAFRCEDPSTADLLSLLQLTTLLHLEIEVDSTYPGSGEAEAVVLDAASQLTQLELLSLKGLIASPRGDGDAPVMQLSVLTALTALECLGLDIQQSTPGLSEIASYDIALWNRVRS
jgi:hypothetical protein